MFGQVLHQVFAFFFNQLGNPLEFFLQVWNEVKTYDLTYNQKESWERLQSSGQALIEKFLKNELHRLGQIKGVEKPFDLRITGLALPFIGIIDLYAEVDGKNTLVEGNVGMMTPNKYPPFISLSDFKHLTPALDTKLNNFESYLASNHTGLDGRISVNNANEYAAATKAGYKDVNGDGYIDEYDLFLKEMQRQYGGKKSLQTRTVSPGDMASSFAKS